MKNRIEIITLPVSSWRKYKEIRLRALEKEPLAFCSTYEKELAWLDGRWKQSLQDVSDGKLWIYFASVDGKVVGMIGGYADAEDRKDHRVHVWGMYVDELYRSKGIGRALVERLFSELGKMEDVHVVCLEVNPVQIFALRLYESLGFSKVGVESHVFCDGLSHDVLVMEKVMH